MRFKKFFSVACLLLVGVIAAAQVQLLESGKKTSIRGLSVVNDQVFWVSGSNGMVARSLNGGANIDWITVPGYEKRDFRDIEALDAQTAIIMAVAEPAVILKTTDGGQHWKKVFEDTTKGMFMDAMDLMLQATGNTVTTTSMDKKNPTLVVVGDPIKGKIFLAVSTDGGDTWRSNLQEADLAAPTLPEGEAFFASSGSNIQFQPTMHDLAPMVWVVSGGTKSNLWDMTHHRSYPLPIMQGTNSTGANALAIDASGKKGVIVGGDFTRDSIAVNNCVLVDFTTAVPTMRTASTPPHGYRSCVVYLNSKELVSCGTSGIDYSKDGGMHWTLLSKEGYHVVQKARTGNAIYLAGGNGRIAKLQIP